MEDVQPMDRPDSAAPTMASRSAGRRQQLAEAAILTLSQRGYARTGLRDIAATSEFSHGVLHYYFRDKGELITECLRLYRMQCTVDHDGDIAEASTPDECAELFAQSFAAPIEAAPSLHRLWFDLRNQAVFEAGFAAEVAAIDDALAERMWRAVQTYAHLAHATPAFDRAQVYALFDGLFRAGLDARLAPGAGPEALDPTRDAVRRLLPALVTPVD